VLVTYFGHHKAASNWIANIMYDLADRKGWRSLLIHNYKSWPGYPMLGDRVRAEGVDLFMHTNARQSDVDTLPEFVGFHVIRDARDTIVSGYFSHQYSHPEDGWPELVEHRRRLQQVDLDQGLHLEIEWNAQFIDFVLEWDYDRPNILELRMEEMIVDPMRSWERILCHLGIDGLPDRYLAEVLARFSFESLAGGRSPGEEDRNHHYRRGVPGDWRNYLTSAHLAAIRERYGDLGKRLAYA
jgi:Sulfotransferase domain